MAVLTSGPEERRRTRLQSCYLGCNFVSQHTDLRSGGTKALASGNARFPQRARPLKRNLCASAQSPAERRVNRLISCGKHSPFSICVIFFQAAAAAQKAEITLPPGSARRFRNHKSAEDRGYLAQRDARKNVGK